MSRLKVDLLGVSFDLLKQVRHVQIEHKEIVKQIRSEVEDGTESMSVPRVVGSPILEAVPVVLGLGESKVVGRWLLEKRDVVASFEHLCSNPVLIHSELAYIAGCYVDVPSLLGLWAWLRDVLILENLSKVLQLADRLQLLRDLLCLSHEVGNHDVSFGDLLEDLVLSGCLDSGSVVTRNVVIQGFTLLLVPLSVLFDVVEGL